MVNSSSLSSSAHQLLQLSLCRSFKRFLKRSNPKDLRHFSLLKEHRFCLATFFWRLLSCSLPPTLSTFGFWTQWWFQGWNSQGDIKCYFFFLISWPNCKLWAKQENNHGGQSVWKNYSLVSQYEEISQCCNVTKNKTKTSCQFWLSSPAWKTARFHN